MFVLTQFILRMSFGLALAMGLTPPRQVTSGFYRNHLYVLLGLNVLAALAAAAHPEQLRLALPLAAAVVSYFGSVVWLYEKPRAGVVALLLVAALSLWGALSSTISTIGSGPIQILDPITSGLVLGVTMAAMLLGHWYLNSPTMALAPLRRLILWMGAAIVARAILCGVALALFLTAGQTAGHGGQLLTTSHVLFLALRWLAGIVAALAVAVMTWQTLKIPNTQSATGILYVGVILTFLGELVSLLLLTQTGVP